MHAIAAPKFSLIILHSPASEEPHTEQLSTTCGILHVNVRLSLIWKGSNSLEQWIQRSKDHWAVLQQKWRAGPGKQPLLEKPVQFWNSMSHIKKAAEPAAE